MHFNQQIDYYEAKNINDKIYLKANDQEFILSKIEAKNICDLLSIVAYDESIIGLIAKRRILSDQLDTLKIKLNNVHNYCRRHKL